MGWAITLRIIGVIVVAVVLAVNHFNKTKQLNQDGKIIQRQASF